MTEEHRIDGKDRAIDWNAGRRAFVRGCGLAAAGAVVLGAARPGEAVAAENIDLDVLNFALNLEYLEAEFYLRATTGKGLSDSDIDGKGAQGPVVGGRKVNFDTKAIRLYAEEIAGDEKAHVQFLRAGLGDARVARPKINLKASFTAAATAAGLITAGQEFDAFANETNFLLASYIFEDVGVTAYKGAAPLLTNKDLLEAAAGILGVEAYHAGIIRTLLYSLGLFKEARAISDARDSLDGASDLDQGIGNAKTANLVPTDANGIAFSRSVPQVKNIVYLSPDGTKGGFYPNGINGAFA
ncbi:ferritin-like domain-containing protein [Chenggangzhangella methanolivorans]|uniref:Ferritin-like domain-containing protein n=1 Tax=Chenggangzhangella methanolivorans TaxID=1437009 RepID=A0A9E6RD36_9HYPH|nr:ferritin-like domain-containing protein [Chenggangzhangella methanolivorans]QZO01089.1 ferritin-like domain-containing protein [Chenggangzhangella methanolivorans]